MGRLNAEWRALASGACVVLLGAGGCGDDDSPRPGGSDAGTPFDGGSRVLAAVHECSDGTDVLRSENIIAIASDGETVFAVDFDYMTLDILAAGPSGGQPRMLASFDYDPLSLDPTTLEVDTSEPGGRVVDHMMADTGDDYVYFAGSRYFWRVPKAGGEVEQVGMEPLPSGWLGRCGFIPDVLTEDALFACRDDIVFRMPRAAGGAVSEVYRAPDGAAIEGFAVSGSKLFVGATGAADGEAGALLEVDLSDGNSRSIQIPAGLSPQYLLLEDPYLYFNSLSDSTFSVPGAAEIQGLYRLNLDSEKSTFLSDAGLDTVEGAVVDGDYVYNVYSSWSVVRFPAAGGDYQSFVDCETDGSTSFGQIQEMAQDEDGIYLEMESYGIRRYAK